MKLKHRWLFFCAVFVSLVYFIFYRYVHNLSKQASYVNGSVIPFAKNVYNNTSNRQYFIVTKSTVIPSRIKEQVPKSVQAEEIVVGVVVCGDRLTETLTMLKSAILFNTFTDHGLRIVVITEDQLNQNFSEKLAEWRMMTNNSFEFELHGLSFPTQYGDEWKSLFKPCAAQRLFLPVKSSLKGTKFESVEAVKEKVACVLKELTDDDFQHCFQPWKICMERCKDREGVYIEAPLTELWDHFKLMNSTQMAALTPEHEDPNIGWYNRFARHPYYGKMGVNSGVMLMHLSRMRQFGWIKYLAPIYKEFRLKLTWGDQDIINIFFHFHPERLLVYSCVHNYRTDHCMYLSTCSPAERSGVVVIHGSRGSFHGEKQPAFRAIYRAMEEYQLTTDAYENLLLPMKGYLEQTSHTNCGKIRHVFMKHMTVSITPAPIPELPAFDDDVKR